MTLDELNNHELAVANHQTLAPEVLTEVFALARAGLATTEDSIYQAPAAPAKRHKRAAASE